MQKMKSHLPLVVIFAVCSSLSPAVGLFEETTVFTGLYNGIVGSNYRIPSLVAAADGSLIAFAEGRASGSDPGSSAGQNRIVWSRSTDFGKTWTKPVAFPSPTVGDCSNPVSIYDPNSRAVYLFYNKWPAGKGQFSVGSGTGTDSCTIWMRKSTDNGATWSGETNITASVKDPSWAASVVGPGNGIVTAISNAGRIIVPSLRNTVSDRNSDPFTFYSDDGGNTWHRNSVANASYHADENIVVELADGKLLLNARTNSNWRAKFLSSDGGASWSGPEPFLQGITPICASTIRYSLARNGDKNRILFSAPAGTSAGPSRNNLSVWISYDEGATFTNQTLVHPGMSAYSSMAVLADGTIGLLYEKDNYKTIGFARFDLQYLGETAVPEPSTIVFGGLGALGMVRARMRRRRA